MIPAARCLVKCTRDVIQTRFGDRWCASEIDDLVLIYLKMAGASSSVGGSLPRTRPAGKPG